MYPNTVITCKNTVTLQKALTLLFVCFSLALGCVDSYAEGRDKSLIHRKSNFSNEFELTTPEGINARGSAVVRSRFRGVGARHRVRIHVNGLTPGKTFVIMNHFFEPMPDRGIGPSDPADDPSCTGHFQFLGEPVVVDERGRLKARLRVEQLAPHIWVVDFDKFLEVTNDGTQGPSSPDAFVSGGLLIPFDHILEGEDSFIDTDPLTICE